MKSALSIISIFLWQAISVNSVFCQTAPSTIQIDFLNMAAKPVYKKVEHGKEYTIKIENINLSIFKIEGSSSQLNYNTVMPEIFKAVKLPGYLNLALPPNPAPAGTDAGASSVRKEVADEMDPITNNLLIISSSIEMINATAELNNKFRNLYASCNKTYNAIATSKILEVNTFLSTNDVNETTQATNLESALTSSIQRAIIAKSALDVLVPKHIATIKFKIKNNKNHIIDQWLSDELPKTHPQYHDRRIVYNTAVDENENYNAYIDSLRGLVTKATESVSELKKFRDDNKINELVKNYWMINESNFTYYSDPIKSKSDVVKFDLKITAENPLSCNLPTKVGISETYKTIGGWKMDFSSGLFLNSGNSDFMGRELQYKSINDDTVRIEAKDGGKRSLLSIGALMHIYYRTGGSVNFAISPGLSTTTAFDGLNFHLGASAIFGGENRLVLTAGVVAREAKILDRNYVFEKDYAKKLMPEAPPTIKVFPKFGWFFSLTYNWSKLK